MMYNAVITLDKEDIAIINNYFTPPYPGEHEPILGWSADFGNGYQADFKVSPASDGESPWTEAVFFQHRTECSCSEVTDWSEEDESFIGSGNDSDILVLMLKKDIPRLDKYPVPDPDLPLSLFADLGMDVKDYFPLSTAAAKQLVSQNIPVYAIRRDNIEPTLILGDDYAAEVSDTFFMISKTDWELSSMFHRAVMARFDHQDCREEALRNHNSICFGIYQVKMDDDHVKMRFLNSKSMSKFGYAVERAAYDLVYTQELDKSLCDLIFSDPSDHSELVCNSVIECLYTQFNVNKPADFHSPSMSVSDVVVIHTPNKDIAYFVDSVGCKVVPDFFTKGEACP